MLHQKIAAIACMFCSVMISVGFLAQFTSYSKYGAVWLMFGFYGMTMVNVWYFLVRNVKAQEVHVFDLVVNLVRLVGIILALLGEISITIIKGPVWLLWVGVIGCILMFVGGVANLAKEIWIETLEEKSSAPVKQGE